MSNTRANPSTTTCLPGDQPSFRFPKKLDDLLFDEPTMLWSIRHLHAGLQHQIILFQGMESLAATHPFADTHNSNLHHSANPAIAFRVILLFHGRQSRLISGKVLR
jgi:hypothetical protein